MKSSIAKTVLALSSAVSAAEGYACSLAQTDDGKIKEKMASAIADHIGADSEDINPADITTPQLLFPLGLGADCSGISAAHHSAGFRLTYNSKSYEGVAVLLGYWYNNPVAVHFRSEEVPQ